MKWMRIAGVVLASVFLLQACGRAQGKLKTGAQFLTGELPAIAAKDPALTYDYKLAEEKFYLFVPKNYTGAEPFGLLVFISPSDGLPPPPSGWEDVLREKKLIYVAPQNVGNAQLVSRRAGLAVVAAAKLMEMANIATNRVYVSGMSGGARIASYVPFVHPALFSGAVAICGTGFCRKVERVKATKDDDYGYMTIDDTHAAETKKRVRFALITGPKDFRYGNVVDLYTGGFQKEGFQAKLLDVPGMGHEMCTAKTLGDSITFLDEKRDLAPGGN